MSWFDTAGLATFAKTALKEAQKQIDKALDIQENEDGTLTIIDPKNRINKTEPSTPAVLMKHSASVPALTSSVWGSFSGSFFDNPVSDGQETVTIPPTSLRKIEEQPPNQSTLSSESESLEILSNPTTPGSNLTSPCGQLSVSTVLGTSESVEVLGYDTPTSEIFSSNSSSFVPSNINSPSSVEVIPEDFKDDDSRNDGACLDDDDDDSISYNTVSDTITAVTVVEPSVADINIITTPPSRSSLHLSLGGSFNLSTFSDSSNESEKTVASAEPIETPAQLPPIPVLITTKALLADTMLEKLSIESYDGATQLSDSTQSFEEVHASALLCSSYQQGSVMSTDSSPPLSTDSKNSDIVKIGSSQTSGHTSGDEIETATSSDIEIISSPNGDSSSTTSICRASPKTRMTSSLLAKSRGFEILGSISDGSSSKKGHSRELSDVSIRTDDSSQNENDKLLRRICELQEILESREYRLVELGRQNAELHEKYQEIFERGQSNSELTNVTEEYTQRLSALEKKFQQSIRERDHLRKQLETAQSDIEKRVDKEYFDKVVKEKEYLMTELRLEGESLSKQVLQHSNIIKKLRAKEKESDTTLKRQKDQIEEFTDEIERLKKSLSAKDEVERSQIEAVHKLSSEKRKLEKENYLFSSQLEDATQKCETLQKSLDVCKLELSDKNVSYCEVMKKTEEIVALESEKKIFQGQHEQMSKQIDEMREKLRQSDTGSSLREQKLRHENSDLLRRLEDAELRSEDQTQAVSLATIPLVKQLEAMQTTLNTRTIAWDKRERHLVEQLEATQRDLAKLNDVEQTSKEKVGYLQSSVTGLEERLSHSLLKTEQSISLLQQRELDYELLERDYKKEILSLKSQHEENIQKLEADRIKIIELEEQLQNLNEVKTQRIAFRRESVSQQDDNRQDDAETLLGDDEKQTSMGSSPTQSLARISICDSGSNVWPLDDFDYISSGARPNGPESVYGSSAAAIGHASFLESLQAALKQRDGEVHQLQWELSRLQSERNYLTSEISSLTSELETIKEKFETLRQTEMQYTELRQQYDAILEMYGEKVEETQELKLDLQDVKEMYKAQIDELLQQQKMMMAASGVTSSPLSDNPK